jgi:carboxypeptidase D
MRCFRKISLVALIISALRTTASAGRLSDFAHRKGFGPNFRFKDVEADKPRNKTRDGFRFYTSKTQRQFNSQKSEERTDRGVPFVVDSLPDVPFNLGEMYAGLMPIDMNNTSRALYYVFQPTVDAPVDEITVWLNGGPGELKYSSQEALI